MTNTVAIIGGGVSGTLTVLQCIKQSQKPLSIIWFDAQNKFCRGFAYSSSNEEHLLNVRAENMSAFAEEPDHFVNWLLQHYPAYHSKSFVPRKLYGDYVSDCFNQLKHSNNLVSILQIAEEVTTVDKTLTGFKITGKQTYDAQKLVLALGNFLPAHPRSVSKDFTLSPHYFQNAFNPGTISKLLTCNDVTIIGSGLTMIDMIVSLAKHSYQGQIHIISPHAYIPQQHQEKPATVLPSSLKSDKKYTLQELLSIVNKQIKQAKKENNNPFPIIDSLRPHLQSLWLNFSLEEKQQFLRHLRHKWGVARHRAPQESMASFNKLMNSGKIDLIKGRISEIKMDGDGFAILYSNSKNESKSLKTSSIVNCTGPESDYSQLKMPLVQHLIKNGLIAPDPLKYGLNAQKNGQLSAHLYTIGPPLKGILWESVAVPEIRVQALELAGKIIFD